MMKIISSDAYASRMRHGNRAFAGGHWNGKTS